MIQSFLFIDDRADAYAAILAPRFPDIEFLVARSPAEAGPLIARADAIAAFGFSLPDALLMRAERLKWLQALSSGVDTLIGRPLLQGKLITSAAGMHHAIVSEMALALMLALARNLPRSFASQRRHAWEPEPGRLLYGKTLGILGMGAIGVGLAVRARSFGMRILGFGTTIRDVPEADRFYTYSELQSVAGEIDYLVLLAPLVRGRPPLVDRAIVDALKPGACIVNVGRGATLDEIAVLDALTDGRLAGAALDALTSEPLTPDSPLWTADNLIITPHLGGFVEEYPELAAPIIETNLRALISGRMNELVNIVAGRPAD